MASQVRRPAAKGNVKKPVPAKKKVKKEKDDDPDKIKFWYTTGKIDIPMLIISLVLLILGITMMFSASHALSYRDNDGNSYEYAVSQMGFAGLGVVVMLVASCMDYRVLRKEFNIKGFTITLSHIALAVGLVLTALVIPFGVADSVGGQKRWLRFAGRTFQPSDILKFALIIFLAYYVWKNYSKMRYTYTGLVKPGILFVVVAVLMMAQPHLSGLLIMFAILAVMLFVGGVNLKTVFLAMIIAVAFIMIAISFSEFSYFEDRIKYMFDPLADPLNKTYQSYQAVLAVGSGGIFGVGFGNSAQKYYYLPEAQNDFVFAVLCEEFGFVGGLLVIILFMIFVFRGFYIARQSYDRFGMMMATGIAVHLGVQAIFNIGVNVCCLPNTGISMPFFSYGGTALVIQLAEVGMLLSISRRSRLT